MTPTLLGQLLGLSFACGLNLYVTVAALGILSRFGLIHPLPTGLRGLESMVVIGSALALFVVEAIIDKVHHADSLWDTVHTFIRPPAAALLAVGTLWGSPVPLVAGAATLALIVSLAAHGTKAGLRLALNAGGRNRGNAWLSLVEDVAAVAFTIAALDYPGPSLAAAGAVLLVVAVVGPRFWRALVLGFRCVLAWVRALFAAPRWHDVGEIPRDLRRLLNDPPLGSAPPRATRAGLHGMRGAGAYRNGWLVLTFDGPVFLYRSLFQPRRVAIPEVREVELYQSVWADIARISTDGGRFTLYLLKDGPALERALTELAPTPA